MSKIKSQLKKFVSINSKPNQDTFPELPDVIVWFRFALALLYGSFLGLSNHSKGAAGILFGLNFISFIPVLYCNFILGADSDSYGSKLYFSGVLNSLALMLLIWILECPGH